MQSFTLVMSCWSQAAGLHFHAFTAFRFLRAVCARRLFEAAEPCFSTENMGRRVRAACDFLRLRRSFPFHSLFDITTCPINYLELLLLSSLFFSPPLCLSHQLFQPRPLVPREQAFRPHPPSITSLSKSPQHSIRRPAQLRTSLSLFCSELLGLRFSIFLIFFLPLGDSFNSHIRP